MSKLNPRLAKQEKMLTESNYVIDKQSDEKWKIILPGPENSPFVGGKFTLLLVLTGFPFKAPIVKFDTQIYHPNVDKDGSICADMLQIGEKWVPVKKLCDIVDKVKALMILPNIDSPMNQDAANDYKNKLWEKKAQQKTQEIMDKMKKK